MVLLHGSGGDEHDLVPPAEDLHRDRRCSVREDGRHRAVGSPSSFDSPDRTLDEADIAARVPILADFMAAASTRYNFTREPIAIGFSNGAIMAAALLLTRPKLMAGAILFRPLSPFATRRANPLGWYAGTDHRRREGQPPIARRSDSTGRAVDPCRCGGDASCAAGRACDHGDGSRDRSEMAGGNAVTGQPELPGIAGRRCLSVIGYDGGATANADVGYGNLCRRYRSRPVKSCKLDTVHRSFVKIVVNLLRSVADRLVQF